jgi:hypothetical protein
MKLRFAFLPLFMLIVSIIALPVAAKHGIQATVHTDIHASAPEGTEINVLWTLQDGQSGRPFSALDVFVRLVGADGDFTEAFAEYPALPVGTFQATATVPKGGVVSIEIGVAGTMTDRAGNSERSDWLMELSNNPIKHKDESGKASHRSIVGYGKLPPIK